MELVTEVTGRTFGEELATAASLLRGPDVLHLPDAVRVAAADLLDAASTARGTPDPYALRLARAVVYAAARSRLGVPTQASAGGVNADAHPREGRSRSGIRVP